MAFVDFCQLDEHLGCGAFLLRRAFEVTIGHFRPAELLTALTGLGQVKSLTRGFVAPPLKISASALGAGAGPMCLPVGEVVVIQRAAVDTLSSALLGQQELVAETGDVLLVFSHGGLNAAPIEAAIYAKARGLKVITVSSHANAKVAKATPEAAPYLKGMNEGWNLTLDRMVDYSNSQ